MNYKIIKFDFLNNCIKKPIIMTYLFVYPIFLFIILSNITVEIFGDYIVSKNYYSITSMLFIQLSMGTMITNMIMENSIKHSNMRLVYIISNPFAIMSSKISCLITLDFISIILYIFISKKIFGINYNHSELWLVLVYLVVGIASVMLGFLLLLIIRDENLTNNILGIIQVSLCLLGGVFFPVSLLGVRLERLSWISPVKWIYRGIINVVYLKDEKSLIIVLITGVILIMVFFMISKKIYKIEDMVK